MEDKNEPSVSQNSEAVTYQPSPSNTLGVTYSGDSLTGMNSALYSYSGSGVGSGVGTDVGAAVGTGVNTDSSAGSLFPEQPANRESAIINAIIIAVYFLNIISCSF